MASASQPLFELQSLETDLDAERAAMHSVDQRLAGDPEIDRLRGRIPALEGERAELQTAIRALERQTEDLGLTLKRLNQTLYGGSIHDAREMASVEAEIGHARGRRTALEDQEIDLLEKMEETEARLSANRDNLRSREAGRLSSLERLRDERQANIQAVATLQARREGLAAEIDPGRLAQYTRLRARLGHAVSRVEADGICQWCRVQIPPKDIQHARGETIVTCGNCGRILYAE